MARAQIPLRADGTHDKDAVEAAFMASPHLDWTRFAEEQGWNPNRTRIDFPVKTWQENKKRILAENHLDTLNAMIFETRHAWSQDVMKTLERYPKQIDKASFILEAKMNEFAEMYKDFMQQKAAGTLDRKRLHPWQMLKTSEITQLAAGINALTNAKYKANMIDKLVAAKLNIPFDEASEQEGGGDGSPFSGITFEGKKDFSSTDMQSWFDNFYDKPAELPVTTNEVTAAPITTDQVTSLLHEKQEKRAGEHSSPKPAPIPPGVVMIVEKDGGS